jgi:hypothetical protein
MVLVLKDMLGQLIFRRRLGSLVKIVAKLKAEGLPILRTEISPS